MYYYSNFLKPKEEKEPNIQSKVFNSMLSSKEELNHKHVNHLEKIPTKRINMAYINCEQDHIDNNIRDIFIKKHASRHQLNPSG